MGVVVQVFIVVGRNCRDAEQPSCGIAWGRRGGGKGLTSSRHANVLDALWGTFDKTTNSLVAILSNNHTCATKLRHEFKVTEDSKFNGGLQMQRLADSQTGARRNLHWDHFAGFPQYGLQVALQQRG